MKFSEQWLRQWVNPAVDTQELCDQLTMAGLEVDAVDPVAAVFSAVVVGEVQHVEPHPDAEKLRICRVDVGAKSPLTIVCGAANVAAGMRVPTALVGAQLPGGLNIEKAKLRGVESSGMLCSATELGLAESSDGLLPLPAEAPVGADVRTYLGLDDVSIELALTPNRGDCLSVAGVAREVGVLNRLPIQAPAFTSVAPVTQRRLDIALKAKADCPRYVGRIIEGVDARAVTPMWMRERLRRSGLRSLGPLVDVTNYVLLELGQPMHAFDLDRLSPGLQIRHAQTGESLTLLDGQTVALEAGTLVIADAAGPQALAGIMGGATSAVRDDTRNIFLESAYFRPEAIAGRARGYGLHTDSSHRFERGVSPALQRQAMERATALLLDIVGGRPGPVIDIEEPSHLPARPPVTLRAARIQRVLGDALPANDVRDILQRLELTVEAVKDGWRVTPPAFRFDIEREEDLIEEVARIYGYSRLASTRPFAPMVLGAQPEGRVTLERLRRVLIERGYQEAITYSFVEPGLQRTLDPEHETLELANPLSAELSVMRTSLWPGLLQAIRYNLNRQQGRIRLFESGLRFIRQDNEIQQEKVMAGAVTGALHPEQWGAPLRPVDFFDIKSDVEALLALTGDACNYIFTKEKHPALHPGQSAAIVWQGKPVGWVGRLHPAVERKLGIAQPVLVFEIEMSALAWGRVPAYQELSKYPAIRRDIAVVVDEAVTAQQVYECIASVAPAGLRNVQLFDMYTGKGIDSGRKSLALGLTLQDLSRTLTDSDVDNVMASIIEALRTTLGGSLRE